MRNNNHGVGGKQGKGNSNTPHLAMATKPAAPAEGVRMNTFSADKIMVCASHGPIIYQPRDFAIRPQLLVRLPNALRRTWRDLLYGLETIPIRVVRPSPVDVDAHQTVSCYRRNQSPNAYRSPAYIPGDS